MGSNTKEIQRAESESEKRLLGVIESIRMFTGCTSMEQASRVVLGEFARHLDAEGGSFFLCEGENLRLLCALDPPHAPESLLFPVQKDSAYGHALESRIPILIEDIRLEQNLCTSGWKGYKDNSALVFPFESDSEVVAILALHNKKTPPFNEGDLSLGALMVPFACEAVRAARSSEKIRDRDQQLRQAHKMEALGQLAGGVAHDFNNLLQAILVHAQFVKESLTPEHPEWNDIQQVLRACDRAAKLTRQLKTFSRSVDLQPVDLRLNKIVDDLMTMVRRMLSEDIELVIKTEPDLGNVHADPGQVEQILMNLSINARDAMPNGGKLTIRTGNVTLDNGFCLLNPWAQEGKYVVLTVADTGIGMDQMTRDRIFEPFFTTKEPGKGTGLGMATVYGIVKQHNGLIHADTAVGQGSTFHIYLPVTKPTGKVSHIAEEKKNLQGTETLLLAEDDDIVRELIVRILKRAGYNVIVAKDGQEAVDLFDKHSDEVDLAVLDVVMPKMNGRVALELIHKRRPELPVVFCSGYSPDTIQVKFIQDQEMEIVAKPYKPHDLLRTIRKVLDRAKVK